MTISMFNRYKTSGII